MDLIRSTIESFFYHMQPEVLAAILQHGPNREADGKMIINRLTEVVSHEKVNFTSSEIGLLGDVMRTQWLVDPELNFLDDTDKPYTPLLQRLPLIINQFSDKVLIEDVSGTPAVQFEHLLRWRELSLFTGEDLLVVPFLAKYDVIRHKSPTRRLLWPNVLNHDNFRLNSILDKELSDTHSHVNAAQDVFEFNWLGLMNYPELIYKDGNFLRKGRQMDYDTAGHFSKINLDMRGWVVIAAALRVYLFHTLPSTDNIQSIPLHPEDITTDDISDALLENHMLLKLLEKLQIQINESRNRAMPADGDFILDYAIQKSHLKAFYGQEIPSSPYLVHHGERELLYRWFHAYYLRHKSALSTVVHLLLYLNIKTKLRREFIQANDLRGFENFQTYQKPKILFSKYITAKNGFHEADNIIYKNLLMRYAVQSSVGEKDHHYLEARVTPDAMVEMIGNASHRTLHKAIFGNGEVMARSELKKHLTFVVHFIKDFEKNEDDTSPCRHASLRDNSWRKMKSLQTSLSHYPEDAPAFAGIDAASSELGCRPEVMAPIFRFAKLKGYGNFTYHAGEDFYDIIDGLRTIAETIDFMGYTSGCRIGHGLAMGVNARGYYAERHNWVIIPRQTLLDNLVWLKYFALAHNLTLSPGTVLLIEERFVSLTSELGYGNINMWDYHQAMLMRGDITGIDDEELNVLPDMVLRSPVSPLRLSEQTRSIHDIYESDAQCRKNGKQPLMMQVPDSYGDDVANIQEIMLRILEQKGIIIETNPSSNLKIGRFSRYDNHPITIFHDVTGDASKHAMVVTINTDDKGVFATSLKNEYSLIALALRKMHDAEGHHLWSDMQIEEYLRRIANYSNITRFKGLSNN